MRLTHLRFILYALVVLLVAYRLGFIHGWHVLLNLINFIVIISVIVFVHEFGHYLVAKLAGVKIDTFSIGFGKEVFGINDRSGTRWKLSSLPLGGYVKMYGDASEASTPLESIASLPEEEKQKTFYYKPLYKKALIVAAGPFANFVLTILILTFFIATRGLPSTEPIVGEIVKDTPAQAAGLEPGDRLLSINGEEVNFFQDIQRMLMTNLGTPVDILIKRGEKQLPVRLTPKEVKDTDSMGNEYKHPIIGIKSLEIKYKKVGPLALWEATRMTYQMCEINLEVIGQMIVGSRSAKENIKGPLGIAQLSGQAAEKGLYTVFLFMANLSAGLGLLNLFPVPMLDGGHLLYYAIEAVSGRPLSKRIQEYGFRIGMAMIAMLMMFAFLNDIRSLLLS